jgi:hypothetical protein
MGFSTETCVLKPRETLVSSPESSASDANDRKNYNQAAASKPRKIRAIQLPQAIMNFGCSMDESSNWYLDCLPLAGHKVLCVDPSAGTVLFDVGMCQLETIPCFNVRKRWPLPCSVPLPSSADAAAAAGNGSFYIFESSPYQETLQGDDGARQQLSHQFVAFVYHSQSKSWQRQLLPPPPFVYDPKHYEHYRHPDITSYAVVERGGSHAIFLSVDGAGTYCLDTVTHTWSYVGDWVLPFEGKVEYVPELKLWFGICTEGRQLGAADLSTVDSQPQIVGTWKELEAPGHWRETKPPQLVNLGSGRFCITRFFCALLNPRSSVNPMVLAGYDAVEDFTVLTGIDVVPCVHDAHGTANDTIGGGNGSKGKVELQMIKHNSRRHMSDGSDGNIEAVF